MESGTTCKEAVDHEAHTSRPQWTEEIIGRWFAKGGGRREDTVLASKVYGWMEHAPNRSGLSALNVRCSLDASLQRLQTDHIDLYQFHHVDRGTPWDEIWQAVDVAVQQGKIIYSGSSNFAGWHIAAAQEAAARRPVTGLVSEQSIYNLFQRSVEREVIPAAEYYGLGLLPWSPLHGGLLGGVLMNGHNGVRRLEGRAAKALKGCRDSVAAFEKLAAKRGEDPAEIALAWLLHQPAVTAPIIGPRTSKQLVAALRAVDVSLNREALARLNQIFPGPKTAPEDYAW